MCGIGGIVLKNSRVGNKEFKEIVQLCRKLEARGTDAFGFIAINQDGSVKRLWKLPGSFSDQFEILGKEMFKAMKGAKAVLVHTRAHTSGNPLKNYNNHPFKIDHLYLAHNGYSASYTYYGGVQRQTYYTKYEAENITPEPYIMTDTYRDLFVPLADQLVDPKFVRYSAIDVMALFYDISTKNGVIGSFWLYDENRQLITILKADMPLSVKTTDQKLIFGSNISNKQDYWEEFVYQINLDGKIVDRYEYRPKRKKYYKVKDKYYYHHNGYRYSRGYDPDDEDWDYWYRYV